MRDLDTLTVLDGRSLPVCLTQDGRLQFTRDCEIVLHHGQARISRYEYEGDSWDGASIPRAAWSVIGHPLLAEYRWASLWHDRLCESSRTIEDRTIADAVFLRLLAAAGVSKPLRMLMWAAVRIYGLTAWQWSKKRKW
jgi:hypothetical protein